MDKILSTRELLIKAPIPKATSSYSPVPHHDIILMTLEELDKQGFSVLSESYKLTKEGKQAQGLYRIAGDDSEMNIQIGWHNSYDKSMPVRWAIGAHIIVCENGMVHGDIGSFKRKHTGTVLQEYREQAKLQIEKAGDQFRRLVMDREKMKNIEITKKATSELMGRLFFEEDLVTATQMSIIKRQMENPSYGNYGAPGSVWEAYNHVTVALKEEHPTRYNQSHMGLHKFIAKEFQIA